MKVEYLKDGSPDCPLVRLYNFTAAEAQQLQAACNQLASGQVACFILHAQAWVESIGDFRLALATGPRDEGFVAEPQPNVFKWILRRQSWDNIHGLIEPFTVESQGFQWLDETGDTSLLLSRDGRW
ncbi:hypothetical protein ACERK3_17095 [Phycisphaerales bacterium AB-hyl4]|uniref:Uncharacterized protein n=1 Tax=Natronomicrosphaera hydrolytica TaxID=3242702 RepID=A0ABV4U8S0_9BACT